MNPECRMYCNQIAKGLISDLYVRIRKHDHIGHSILDDIRSLK